MAAARAVAGLDDAIVGRVPKVRMGQKWQCKRAYARCQHRRTRREQPNLENRTEGAKETLDPVLLDFDWVPPAVWSTAHYLKVMRARKHQVHLRRVQTVEPVSALLPPSWWHVWHHVHILRTVELTER